MLAAAIGKLWVDKYRNVHSVVPLLHSMILRLQTNFILFTFCAELLTRSVLQMSGIA